MKRLIFWPFNKKKQTKTTKKIIGRLERINIPSLEVNNILAKVDTGAYRGSIHVENIEEFEDKGNKKLSFYTNKGAEGGVRKCVVEQYREVKVRNPGIAYMKRYAIPAIIELGNKKINVELTLNNRSEMRYPVLLGRKYLKKCFIVDPEKKFTLVCPNNKVLNNK